MQKTQKAKSPERRILTRQIDSRVPSSTINDGRSCPVTVPKTVTASLCSVGERENVGTLDILLTAFGVLLHRYTRGESELSVRVSTMLTDSGAELQHGYNAEKIARNYQVEIHLRDAMNLADAVVHVSEALSAAVPADIYPNLFSLARRDAFVSLEWRESEDKDAPAFSAALSTLDGFRTDIRHQNFVTSDSSALLIENHWQEILSTFDPNWDTPISFLPIMGVEERRRILREWRGAPHAEELSKPECLHHLFEARASAHPERTALLCAGERMTYGELEARANKVARRLRALGVQPGGKVGIFLSRSMDVYVAMLGILKAGAAYVPIDPEYPADRVDYILNDCRVAALVSCSALSSGLSSGGYPVIDLDEDRQQIERESSGRLEATDITPDDLAYIIYTSGSTGRPKGVQIQHRSVCNFVRSEATIFRIGSEDRVFQGFSVAFDASVEEIWLAFNAGATLVVGTHEMVHAGPALARILSEQKVTVLSCVPTLISMVEDDIPTLRLLILGGEQCPKDLVARWHKNGRRVVNTYGPTEATVVATYDDCHPDKPITIGRPVPNYFTYILDANLQPTPAGVPGELHLGGISLSRGYLNRPELTEEKFIANPFAAEDPDAPERLYKTGDLVRFTKDGDIEYLGRIDAQVKLRGFRIELSEIESVLMTCPGVQSAVVAVREDIPGIQQLIAYVIPQQERAFDESELRSTLRSRLPAYMIPARFVTMRDFPTLASGKVDRKRLPAPKQQVDEEIKCVVPPATETERCVLQVWEKIFQPQHVSIEDDFFELGGHSLLAARMVSELRKDPRFSDVSMLDVYKHPILSDFAANMDESARASSASTSDDNPAHDRFHVPSRISYYACAAAQAIGIYITLGVFLIPWLASYRAFRLASAQGHGLMFSMLAATAVSVLMLPLLALIPVAAKWLVIGRYKAGSYPLWGWYYWRFWFVRRLQSIMPLTYLRGTPLLPVYYRLMGAKIGSDVYIGTHYVQVTDLLTIGDDSSVGVEAQLPGYTIENGMLNIGPITIGKRSYIGTKSVVHPYSTVEDDGRLDELSMLPNGSTVPAGEVWAGSPAAYVAKSNADETAESPRTTRLKSIIYGLMYAAGLLLFLPMVPILASLPAGAAILYIEQHYGPLQALLTLPLTTALFTVLFCLGSALVKKIVLARTRPGRYRVQSLFHVRKWFVDTLMQMCLELMHPLYATLYLPSWFRLLGAKLGRRVEISTVAHITPDLLSIGAESFIADSACIGATRVHRGWLTVEPTSIGCRTFVGNSALIPAGSYVGNGYLIGVMSTTPSESMLEANPSSSWLGSPSVLLPRRQESAAYPDSVTFNPPWYLYLVRGTIEFFRVTLPSSLFVLVLATFIHSSVLVYRATSLPALILLFPALFIGCSAIGLLLVIAIKWAVMGTYKPCTRPLWSSFVWRTEMVTAIHESFAAPALLNALQGTPFLTLYFRLMGSKIGKRVMMETTQITEFDLVHVGDDAALNANCTIQTHLFEDRVMKTSNLWIGDRCSIGTMAVALYDSQMSDGASLDGLSLLMKGENLPSCTRWEGIPARRNCRTDASHKDASVLEAPCTAAHSNE